MLRRMLCRARKNSRFILCMFIDECRLRREKAMQRPERTSFTTLELIESTRFTRSSIIVKLHISPTRAFDVSFKVKRTIAARRLKDAKARSEKISACPGECFGVDETMKR